MSDASPFTDEQQKVLQAVLRDLESYIQDVDARLTDQACDFNALKEVLIDKGLLTDDEFVVRLRRWQTILRLR